MIGGPQPLFQPVIWGPTASTSSNNHTIPSLGVGSHYEVSDEKGIRREGIEKRIM